MGRVPRITTSGIVYHVLNRRVMRLPIFEDNEDYLAFERVLVKSLQRVDAPRLLTYCLMPNHWHLVVQAIKNTNLSTWMQWTSLTHTQRWHVHYHTTGQGPLYQGRFKSFPVQADEHFLTLCRYVEANASRAKLVKKSENWQWGSMYCRKHKKALLNSWLSKWPVDRPRNWSALVNKIIEKSDLKTMRHSVARGTPLGSDNWKNRMAKNLSLKTTLRPRGGQLRKRKKST